MSLDLGRWKASTEVELVVDSLTEDDLGSVQLEIPERAYRTPLAPGTGDCTATSRIQ